MKGVDSYFVSFILQLFSFFCSSPRQSTSESVIPFDLVLMKSLLLFDQKQTFTIDDMSNIHKRQDLGERGVEDMVDLT